VRARSGCESFFVSLARSAKHKTSFSGCGEWGQSIEAADFFTVKAYFSRDAKVDFLRQSDAAAK
jgi:hypothetical protein